MKKITTHILKIKILLIILLMGFSLMLVNPNKIFANYGCNYCGTCNCEDDSYNGDESCVPGGTAIPPDATYDTPAASQSVLLKNNHSSVRQSDKSEVVDIAKAIEPKNIVNLFILRAIKLISFGQIDLLKNK